MKLSLILTAAVLALGNFAHAQNPAKPAPRVSKPGLAPEPGATPAEKNAIDPTEADAPEKTIARFFGHLQRKDVETAYEQLTKNTKIAERPDDVRMLKSKTTDAIKVFGMMSGYDQISKKAVGERLLCYTYLSLGKEFPLRWRFYFYKPQDSWKLIDLRVDDRLASIFDEPEDPRTRE
jgi:hypothetical protein